jgi:hypothetical protein
MVVLKRRKALIGSQACLMSALYPRRAHRSVPKGIRDVGTFESNVWDFNELKKILFECIIILTK